MTALAGRYFSGQGVPPDVTEGVRWYRMAAEQGNVMAQLALGVMYADGRSSGQDGTDAERWFRRAVAQGVDRAQYDFRVVYADDRGVGLDDVTTHMWLDLAASRSTGEVQELVASLRESVAQRMTRNQITEAQRRTRVWGTARQ